MRQRHEKTASIAIIAAGVLGAAAVLLVPGLFVEFRAGRAAAIAALMLGALTAGVCAKWHRNRTNPQDG